MTPLKQDSQEIAKRLKSVIDYIQDCERRVSRGDIMDLQGLDQNVVDICDAIAGLEPKDARILEPQMSVLIEGLERLAHAMKDQQSQAQTAGAG